MGMKKHRFLFWSIIGGISVITGIATNVFQLRDYLFGSRKNGALQLTVYVPNELEGKGKLLVDFGNDRRDPVIGENGRTNIGEIPENFENKEIPIQLIASGYKLNDSNKRYKLNGEPVYLQVKKDFGRISGIVKDRKGNKFIENAEILINTDTTTKTNSWGVFSIDLPENMQKESYRLIVRKKGYKPYEEIFTPLSNDVEIRLDLSK